MACIRYPHRTIVRSNGARGNPTIHLGRIKQDNADCHVIRLNLRDLQDWGMPWLHHLIGSKRLIIVVTPPNQHTALSEASSHEDVEIMEELAFRLSMYCRIRYSASDIVMVKFGALAALSPLFRAEIVIELCEHWLETPAPWIKPPKGVVWKTQQEIKLVTFKSVTMREYLTSYDWSGEYTEEEAAEMLAEEIEEERAAEIEEATEGPVE